LRYPGILTAQLVTKDDATQACLALPNQKRPRNTGVQFHDIERFGKELIGAVTKLS
jgi:hypothetical protein